MGRSRLRRRRTGSALHYSLLDGGQNELAGGATLARGRLVQPAVEIPRQIDGGADGAGVDLMEIDSSITRNGGKHRG